jgi:hypothetical protein
MSRCVRVGWTGLGWATPWGGQALIRSHRPGSSWWVGSTGHCEDRTRGVRQPVHWVRPHPDRHAVRGRCLNVWRAT